MAKAKTARTPKSKSENNKNLLQMPENGNGNTHHSAAYFDAQIRVRAYEIYERRGCTPGQDEEDWLAAEREILSRQDKQTHTA